MSQHSEHTLVTTRDGKIFFHPCFDPQPKKTIFVYAYVQLYLNPMITDLLNLFRALADASRIRILNLLFAAGELCVCDIQSILKFSQPKASRHLAYLKHSGLVNDRRQGLWMIYSLNITNDEIHERLIKELRDVFSLSAELQNDLRALHKNVNAGCCTTFSEIFPTRKLIQITLPRQQDAGTKTSREKKR